MRIAFAIIIILNIITAKAQSNIYSGGEGAGFSSNMIMETPLIYEGGENDGYESSIQNGNPEIYKGGIDNGYVSGLIFGISEIFEGGIEDGYASVIFNGLSEIYSGGFNDGYISSIQIGIPDIYLGGTNDGYAIDSHYVPFTWTGAIGTGWNVPGNWNSNIIPTHNRPTIIPANVPNYPGVNAGIFSIGQEYREADFYSGQLLIRQGAELTTRINCSVILHGYAQILGMWKVKNMTPGSFLNKGELEIDGSMIFSEH